MVALQGPQQASEGLATHLFVWVHYLKSGLEAVVYIQKAQCLSIDRCRILLKVVINDDVYILPPKPVKIALDLICILSNLQIKEATDYQLILRKPGSSFSYTLILKGCLKILDLFSSTA